jgi:hypothetical protein
MDRRLLACALLAILSCGDDDGGECGVADQTVSGATLSTDGVTFGYGNFIWGLNNDCGQSSVTIRGGQVSPEPATAGLGLCLPNPGAIGSAPLSFANTAVVQLVGASAENDGCSYTPAFDAQAIGDVTFEGFCTTEGTIYKVTFDAVVPGRKVCEGGEPEGIMLDLAGTALVRPQ